MNAGSVTGESKIVLKHVITQVIENTFPRARKVILMIEFFNLQVVVFHIEFPIGIDFIPN